jgi:hypothetical protein
MCGIKEKKSTSIHNKHTADHRHTTSSKNIHSSMRAVLNTLQKKEQ